MLDKKTIRFIAAMMTLTGVLGYAFGTYHAEAGCRDSIATYKMYHDIRLSDVDFGIHGIYRSPDYYCVWTQDRSPQEIQSTEYHEECHDLVRRQREHFCGEP